MSSLYIRFYFCLFIRWAVVNSVFFPLLTFSSETRDNPFPGALSQDLTMRGCPLRCENQKEKRSSYCMMVVSSTDMGKQQIWRCSDFQNEFLWTIHCSARAPGTNRFSWNCSIWEHLNELLQIIHLGWDHWSMWFL